MDTFLNRKSPAYLGGTLEYLTAPQLRARFESLALAVRRGGTAVSNEGTVSRDNPIWVTFARMAPVMRLPAGLLSRLIRGNREQPLRVLDVAAGYGLVGIHPGTLVEFPRGKPAAFALAMLATTAAGDANTFREYEEIPARAGFARSKFHPSRSPISRQSSRLKGEKLQLLYRGTG